MRDYKANEEILQKMLGYVAVPMPNGAQPLRLSTREVASNHIRDWEQLAKLELALMQYNTSFFLPEEARNSSRRWRKSSIHSLRQY